MKKLLLLLLASLLFVGCTAEPAPEEAKKVLRVAFGGDVLSLDSTVATDGVSFEVLTAFTEGLVEYDAADATLPGSGAAESWDVSEDGLVYVFNLKKDAVWSNGDPVTAKDFVFAWRRLVDPALANEYSLMAQNAKLVNADAVIAGELPVDQLGVEA
ncbi:MAG: ABC transporter substrate-binding protein, partial [Ignavibacteria bacterium]|nr:ABC transporter substrate-binding protein [Ignavibacteria bacterium]